MINTVQDLAAYLGKTVEETDAIIDAETGRHANAGAWDEANPKTHGDIFDFYVNSEYYIGELARYEDMRKDKFAGYLGILKDWRGCSGRMLDIGAGDGGFCILAAQAGWNVDYFDIGTRVRNFARWRFEKHQADIKILNHLGDFGKYECIVAIDTIEHMSEPDAFIDLVLDRLLPGCVLGLTKHFGGGRQHLKKNAWFGAHWKDWLKEKGLKQTDYSFHDMEVWQV